MTPDPTRTGGEADEADEEDSVGEREADRTGTVEALFTAPESGAPPEPLESVRIRSNGIEGDRYQLGEGHFQLDACPVTLVAAEAIAAVETESGIDVSDGRHRRNVVIRGFGTGMDDLLDATVAVGDALLRPTRRRPPCAHVEELAGADGLAAALRNRGGLCCDVVEPGPVAAGDPVTVAESDPRTAGAAIADRLRERATGSARPPGQGGEHPAGQEGEHPAGQEGEHPAGQKSRQPSTDDHGNTGE